MSLMNPPQKISTTPSLYYDEVEGICRLPEESVCRDKFASKYPAFLRSPPKDSFRRYSPQRLAYDAFGSSYPTSPSKAWGSSLLLGPASLVFSLTGCGEDPAVIGLSGRPIAFVEPKSEEVTLNDQPIEGKLRQSALSTREGNQSIVAWSVIDEADPSQHGTFTFARSGETGGTQEQVATSTQQQSNTSVVSLRNGQSVVIFSRFTGEEGGDVSSLVAQLVDAGGKPLGNEISILPEVTFSSSARTEVPSGQVVPMTDGFLVVYNDGAGNLTAARYGFDGISKGETRLSDPPVRYKISHGSGDRWALAEAVGSNQIRVRTFNGVSGAGVDQILNTSTFSSTSNISMAMQPDGVLMLGWNAVRSDIGPIVEGAFLDSSGNQVGSNRVLRNLGVAQPTTEEHFNSHGLASDGQGNFVFVFEENNNLIAHFYNGDRLDPNSLTSISSSIPDSSGPYFDILKDLSNLKVQNLDVRAAISPEGLLSVVYTKILSGNDNLNATTTSLQRITRRDYQINYQ